MATKAARRKGGRKLREGGSAHRPATQPVALAVRPASAVLGHGQGALVMIPCLPGCGAVYSSVPRGRGLCLPRCQSFHEQSLFLERRRRGPPRQKIRYRHVLPSRNPQKHLVPEYCTGPAKVALPDGLASRKSSEKKVVYYALVFRRRKCHVKVTLKQHWLVEHPLKLR
jgi:hypothetical protein